VMKAKAIPLSTKRSNSSPTERAVRGAKGFSQSGLRPGVTAPLAAAPYYVHLRAHLEA
jgi:hypothetical protein